MRPTLCLHAGGSIGAHDPVHLYRSALNSTWSEVLFGWVQSSAFLAASKALLETNLHC